MPGLRTSDHDRAKARREEHEGTEAYRVKHPLPVHENVWTTDLISSQDRQQNILSINQGTGKFVGVFEKKHLQKPQKHAKIPTRELCFLAHANDV